VPTPSTRWSDPPIRENFVAETSGRPRGNAPTASVVEQAALEGVPLADVEKRMMYFTESDAASCDSPIELNDEF